MPILTVYAEVRRLANCKSCGASIVWAELAKSHRRIPFDAPITIVRSSFGYEDVDTAITKTHFETCPNAAQHRRKQSGPA